MTTITDKNEIYNWLEEINSFDEYRDDNKKEGSYCKVLVIEAVNSVLELTSKDEETQDIYHNPLNQEFYEIDSEDDSNYIAEKLIENMKQLDASEGE